MMRSLSSLGLGLSLVFGCLLLALVAELYYLLWWKKRLINREIENDDYSSNPAKEILYMFCWKKPSSLSSTSALNPQHSVRKTTNYHHHHHQEEEEAEARRRPFGEEEEGEDDDESEFMRLYDLSGPPRFLFTIKEETREDLESEDGNNEKSRGGKSRKGSRSRSLSDLLVTIETTETPFLTPLASPTFFTPPLTPMDSGLFNPRYESSTDAEFNKIIRSSPPPKFKFLQDAEEKLHRRKLMNLMMMMKEQEEEEDEESEKRVQISDGSVQEIGHKKSSKKEEDQEIGHKKSSKKEEEEEEGSSYITIIVAKNKEHNQIQPQYHSTSSSSSQVLPLASSPSSFKPTS